MGVVYASYPKSNFPQALLPAAHPHPTLTTAELGGAASGPRWQLQPVLGEEHMRDSSASVLGHPGSQNTPQCAHQELLEDHHKYFCKLKMSSNTFLLMEDSNYSSSNGRCSMITCCITLCVKGLLA